MAPRTKRQRATTGPAATETIPAVARTLPADLMLEIIARSEPRTLFRCAAASKFLRREILDPSFILRVSHHHAAAPCILAYLNVDGVKPLITPVYPATALAASFCRDCPRLYREEEDRLWRRHISRSSHDMYRPETSRRGLVLLRRRNTKNRPRSDRGSDMCVYDPISGACTFLSRPPGIEITGSSHNQYVLLTAADGIDRPFLLLVVQLSLRCIVVQTASWCGAWGPVTYVESQEIFWCHFKPY